MHRCFHGSFSCITATVPREVALTSQLPNSSIAWPISVGAFWSRILQPFAASWRCTLHGHHDLRFAICDLRLACSFGTHAQSEIAIRKSPFENRHSIRCLIFGHTTCDDRRPCMQKEDGGHKPPLQMRKTASYSRSRVHTWAFAWSAGGMGLARNTLGRSVKKPNPLLT